MAISFEGRRVTEGLLESMNVVSSLKDAETCQRGYILTGSDVYLEPFNVGRRNARVQSQMIEDFLDMSRIVSGKLRQDIQRVDLMEVINAALDAVKPAAHARGVRVESILDPTLRAAASTSATRVELRDGRVLVVDDEADSRGLVNRILTEAHAEVAAAESVNAALRLFDEFRPMVVLSDIGMPERDGYDLIRTIRERGAGDGGHTPAAALSALPRSEDRIRAMIAGYQLHIAKPVEASELLAAVASLAKLHVGRSQTATRA